MSPEITIADLERDAMTAPLPGCLRMRYGPCRGWRAEDVALFPPAYAARLIEGGVGSEELRGELLRFLGPRWRRRVARRLLDGVVFQDEVPWWV